ncbi:MAG: TIGR02757 family protein [Candidatus Gastranaerophilales bacterium]
MITKLEIDDLVEKYETIDFIKDDPIQFAHKYKNSKPDCEIAAFISSLLSYGNRKVFIKKLDYLFSEIMQNEPHNFIQNYENGMTRDFQYRFGKEHDFEEIFKILKKSYNQDGGLEELFYYGFKNNKMFETVTDYFYSLANKNKIGHGFYHMIPNPRNGGAMKRMCMLLRWLVRKSEVDLGLWGFMKTNDLYIPLDVHVARISREMGLLERKSNDFKAVIELTNNLKTLDDKDPIKYDFAMFGYGIDR